MNFIFDTLDSKNWTTFWPHTERYFASISRNTICFMMSCVFCISIMHKMWEWQVFGNRQIITSIPKSWEDVEQIYGYKRSLIIILSKIIPTPMFFPVFWSTVPFLVMMVAFVFSCWVSHQLVWFCSDEIVAYELST